MSERYTIEVQAGGKISDELRELRSLIYQNELGFLTETTLENADDTLGSHIVVTDRESGKAVACGHVYPAETGEFAEHSGLNPADLTRGVYITRVMVHPSYRGQGLIKLVLYLCCQEGRRLGRRRMFCFTEENEYPTHNVLHYERIPSLQVREVQGVGGKTHRFLAGTQRLDLAIHRSWTMMPEALQKAVVADGFLAREAISLTERRIEEFFTNRFFDVVRERKLTHHQYLWTLAGFHQFVRHTTRILGRAISLAENKDLRRHFLEHLDGEIDHEVQLETDLRSLGGDVDFVRDGMPASVPTRKFMAIQEATLAYRNNPLSFIGVPFAIEGFTAHLDDTFLDNLEACIASWGKTKNPRRATTFLRAHIVSDGGEDGHWAHNKKSIQQFLTSEEELRDLLTVINMTFDTMNEIYADFVAEPDFTTTSAKLDKAA